MANKDVTFTFDMDSAVHLKLKGMAEEGHRTLAGQLRLIIEDFLKRQDERQDKK